MSYDWNAHRAGEMAGRADAEFWAQNTINNLQYEINDLSRNLNAWRQEAADLENQLAVARQHNREWEAAYEKKSAEAARFEAIAARVPGLEQALKAEQDLTRALKDDLGISFKKIAALNDLVAKLQGDLGMALAKITAST